MNVCFTASRIMKASEVSKLCKRMKENPRILLMAESQAKEVINKYFLRKRKDGQY